MKIDLEKVDNYLGSWSAKFLFLAIILLFIGSFFLTTYENGNAAVCSGYRSVIESNIIIEKQLVATGHKNDAILLHNSLVKLAKRADDCDVNLLKLLKRKRDIK